MGKAVCKDGSIVATVNLDKDVIDDDEIVEDKTDLDPRVAAMSEDTHCVIRRQSGRGN